MRIAPVSVLFFALACPLLAAEPPAEPLLDRVKGAYRDTRQYAAEVHFAIEQQRGRWHTLQETTIPVAFDRETRQLLVDRPDMRVVVGGGSLKLVSGNIPARYLDAPLAGAPVGPGAPPITYQALTTQVPHLNDPPFPALAFLLEEDPVAALTLGAAKQVEELGPAEGDDLGRPRLRFEMMGRTFTLTIDPMTHLIARTEIDAGAAMFGGQEGDGMRWSFEHRVTAHNRPLPADAFALDTGDRVAAQTMRDLIAPPRPDEMQRARGAAAMNKPAPPLQTQLLTGEDYDLAKEEAKVVVLDFWATWCGPCEPGLLDLQQTYEWVQKEGKSVAIYTVNLAERPDQIEPYRKERGLTMPVLLDPRGEIAAAWGVDGIPATFIIEGGVIRRMHVGFGPGQGDVLRAEIVELLGDGEEPVEAQGPPRPPL